ncbi:S-layer protein [Candidatus Woesearchaeota archaeon]|nr:S-layer protein [Nanoarchaeota archaeon]MCB9370025.1 S-layer protein [Candidatus Woesearchaeota archaeon]USN44558.1 MAG: S-layer protein [Candidatus Woesearchaeota archaeon]
MNIYFEKDGEFFVLQTKELSFEATSTLSSSLAKLILEELAKEAQYSKQLAKKLGIHEQTMYYYMRKLERAGLITVKKEEMISGSLARFYEPSSASFFVRLAQWKKAASFFGKVGDSYLDPFIVNAQLHALFVVGSPDPHGPQKARSKDGYFGMDLALFFGSYLQFLPESRVKLDTEVSEQDLRENNLIVLGGPIVNKVSAEINAFLPVRFDEKEKSIFSSLSKRTYYNDEIGTINKIISPYNREKRILHVSGLRNAGTKAAILAFLKHFDELKHGNNYDGSVQSRVVEGLDVNSDGVVDEIEFLE